MEVFHYQNVEAKDAGEGTSGLSVRWLITKEMGAENFAMRLFEMKSGGYSPYHSHPWEHEVFILEGEGVVVGRGGEKNFGVGDVIFVPPNEKHQFKNNSGKTMKFLCLIPFMPK
jgi:quercetin dioxygenase-like cupin family protein